MSLDPSPLINLQLDFLENIIYVHRTIYIVDPISLSHLKFHRLILLPYYWSGWSNFSWIFLKMSSMFIGLIVKSFQERALQHNIDWWCWLNFCRSWIINKEQSISQNNWMELKCGQKKINEQGGHLFSLFYIYVNLIRITLCMVTFVCTHLRIACVNELWTGV